MKLMKLYIVRSVSLCGIWHTPMALSHFSHYLSVVTMARTITLVLNIFIAISVNS